MYSYGNRDAKEMFLGGGNPGKIASWYFLLNVSALSEDCLNPFSFPFASISCFVLVIPFHLSSSLLATEAV